MGNQFPFTTGSFKQAVNLAGIVLAIWSLSLAIVHCFDLFGMIYSFNVLRGKKVWVKFRCKFVVLLSEAFKKAKKCIFLKSRGEKKLNNPNTAVSRIVLRPLPGWFESESGVEEALSKPGEGEGEGKETTAWDPRRCKLGLDLACQPEMPCAAG